MKKSISLLISALSHALLQTRLLQVPIAPPSTEMGCKRKKQLLLITTNLDTHGSGLRGLPLSQRGGGVLDKDILLLKLSEVSSSSASSSFLQHLLPFPPLFLSFSFFFFFLSFLSLSLSLSISRFLSFFLSFCLSVCLSVCLSICLSICLSVCQPVMWSVDPCCRL